jgi:chemotaxis signal transduction protein
MNQLKSEKKQRFILTKVGELTVVFSSELVAEIGIVERNKIMNLPFYSNRLKGCLYYNGKIISLVDLKTILGLDSLLNKEKMIVVCLSQKAEQFQDVGLIIDKVLGSKNEEELAPEFLTDNQEFIKLFQLEMLDKNLGDLQSNYSKSNY